MQRLLLACILACVGCTGSNPDYLPDSRRVFVTSARYEASVVLDKDLCTLAAETGRLTGNWIAWISSASVDSASVDALGRLKSGSVWFDLRGRTIFPDRSYLTIGPVNPIDTDEFGRELPLNSPIWTGTGPQGQRSENLCLDPFFLRVWASVDPSDFGDVGRVGRMDKAWTYDGPLDCSKTAHLLCFEQ